MTRSYIALALYLFGTSAAGADFFQLNEESRPYWLVGAAFVLLLSCRIRLSRSARKAAERESSRW